MNLKPIHKQPVPATPPHSMFIQLDTHQEVCNSRGLRVSDTPQTASLNEILSFFPVQSQTHLLVVYRALLACNVQMKH